MITVREIISMAALHFGFDPGELVAHRRHRDATLARHVAMYVAKKTTGQSLTAIGRSFGGRDHTSVMHALDRIARGVEADNTLKAAVNALIAGVEYRERLAAFGPVDVLWVAGYIAAHPQRRAMEASVMEITALADTVRELWEIAQAAEQFVHLARRRAEMLQGEWAEIAVEDWNLIDDHMTALGAAITEEMAALRGDTDTEETHHASSHS
ncbi:helix-turn-helix domain-containing protein [Nitratireductor soli]|uniref:helix-turn-helix domain-containing protein n=1 Tax=Nitratireductor soli TaxID=1670619 RepID=UPI00065E8C53|nr:helix-turn-helix domain-containing protein [Nitratireductor soli]